jgi:hypothetical protein
MQRATPVAPTHEREVLKMKNMPNTIQHLPAIAVRRAAVCSWNGFLTNGLVAATHADATRSAKTRPAATAGTAVVAASYKRTAQFLIRDSSPPV